MENRTQCKIRKAINAVITDNMAFVNSLKVLKSLLCESDDEVNIIDVGLEGDSNETEASEVL